MDTAPRVQDIKYQMAAKLVQVNCTMDHFQLHPPTPVLPCLPSG